MAAGDGKIMTALVETLVCSNDRDCHSLRARGYLPDKLIAIF